MSTEPQTMPQEDGPSIYGRYFFLRDKAEIKKLVEKQESDLINRQQVVSRILELEKRRPNDPLIIETSHIFAKLKKQPVSTPQDYLKKIHPQLKYTPDLMKLGLSIHSICAIYSAFFFPDFVKNSYQFYDLNADHHLPENVVQSARAYVYFLFDLYSYDFKAFHQMMKETLLLHTAVLKEDELLVSKAVEVYFPQNKNKDEHPAEWAELLEWPIYENNPKAIHNNIPEMHAHYLEQPCFMREYVTHLTDRKGQLIPLIHEIPLENGEIAYGFSTTATLAVVKAFYASRNARHLKTLFAKYNLNPDLMARIREDFLNDPQLLDQIFKASTDSNATMRELLPLAITYHFEEELAVILTYFYDKDKTEALLNSLSSKQLENFYQVMSSRQASQTYLWTLNLTYEKNEQPLPFALYRAGILDSQKLANMIMAVAQNTPDDHVGLQTHLLKFKNNWRADRTVETAIFQAFQKNPTALVDFIQSLAQKKDRQELIERNMDAFLNAFHHKTVLAQSLLKQNDMISFLAQKGDKNAILKIREQKILKDNTLYALFFTHDADGMTPIHYIFQKGHKSLLQALSKLIPNAIDDACEMIVNLRNIEEQTPFDLAGTRFLMIAESSIPALAPYIRQYRLENDTSVKEPKKRLRIVQKETLSPLTDTQKIAMPFEGHPYLVFPKLIRQLKKYPSSLREQVKKAITTLTHTRQVKEMLDKKNGYDHIYTYRIYDEQGNSYRLVIRIEKGTMIFNALMSRGDKSLYGNWLRQNVHQAGNKIKEAILNNERQASLIKF